MSILDSYKSIAESLNFSLTDEDMFLTKMPTGTEQPTTIDGKRLVMPNKAFLRKGFGEDKIAFHPLSESMARDATSEVQKRMQKQAKAVIGHQLVTLTQGIMDLVSDTEKHKKVPVKQSGFLKELSDLDKGAVININKILAAAIKRNKLVTVYLKASGIINGTKMNRVTTIHFPFISELLNDSSTVFGIKLPKKHRSVAIKLFEMIIPNGADHNEYSVGSNSRVAPYFTSFILAYHKVMSHLNGLLEKFNKFTKINLHPVILFDEEIVKDFSKQYDEIPPLRGNIGGVEETEEIELPWEEKSTTSKAQPKASKKAEESNTISPDDFFASMNRQQPQFQPQQFQPQQFQPQMQYNQPTVSGTAWNMGQPQQMQQMNPFMQSVQPQFQQQPQQFQQQQMQNQWNSGLTNQVMMQMPNTMGII